MGPLMLAPYSEARPWTDREAAAVAIRDVCAALDVEAVLWPCRGPYDYADGLRRLWGAEPWRQVLVCEHDVVPTVPAVLGLLSCPHPWCVVAYAIDPCSTGLPAPVWQPRVRRYCGGLHWVEEGEEWATRAGLGLARFRGTARAVEVPRCEWSTLDDQLSIRLEAAGVPCHVHWPAVEHWHARDGGAVAHGAGG